MIHPSAQIDPAARLGTGVSVGPWSIIGPGVDLGDGTEIGPHVVIRGPTRIGRDNRIFAFCSVGDDPQDKKFRDDPDSRLEIGDGNTIREYCSINRGTAGGGGVTRLGDGNWIMAYCHVAHDCRIGDHTILANHSTLAGHVTLDDYCILGGFTGIHQFCRMGESAFTAISAIVVKDVPPFVMVEGNTARARAINREGLKRRGFETATIEALKRAYRTLYRQGLTLNRALEELAEMVAETPEIGKLVEFIRASERGIVRCRRD